MTENPSIDIDLKAIFDYVLKTQGKAAWGRARHALSSVTERFNYAVFHYHEMRRLLDDYLDIDPSDANLMRLVFTPDDEIGRAYVEKRFQAKAHVLAFLQSLHSLADIVSNAVYSVVGMQEAKAEHDINVRNVTNWLVRYPGHDALRSLMLQWTNNPDYVYLADLTNHCKHRGVLSPGVRLDLTADVNPAKLVFPAFSFKPGRAYELRPAYAFCESEYNRLKRLFFLVAIELDRWVHEASG